MKLGTRGTRDILNAVLVPASPQRPAKAASAAKAADPKQVKQVDTFRPPAKRLGGALPTGPVGAPSLPPVKARRALQVPIECQGQTNGCGTTSLAAVLSYWGVPTTRTQVDQAIRRLDSFTSPIDVLDYATKSGMRASLKNDASLDDIAKMIDQGAPPMVLIDPDAPDNANLHYMVVTGYERGPDGKIARLSFSDPATGATRELSADEFSKQWGNLQLEGKSTGLNNVLISIAPADDRSVTGPDGATRKASEIEFPTTDPAAQKRALPALTVGELASTAVNQAGKVVEWLSSAGQAASDAVSRVWDAVKGVLLR